MKRFLLILSTVLTHASLIEALMVLTLFITDRQNRAMGFMTAEISKWLIFIFCITVIMLVSLLLWRRYRRRGDK